MSNQITIKGESYEIIELLGKGGFGHVFKVKSGSNFFALKVEQIQNNVKETGLLKEKKVLLIFFQIIAPNIEVHTL